MCSLFVLVEIRYQQCMHCKKLQIFVWCLITHLIISLHHLLQKKNPDFYSASHLKDLITCDMRPQTPNSFSVFHKLVHDSLISCLSQSMIVSSNGVAVGRYNHLQFCTVYHGITFQKMVTAVIVFIQHNTMILQFDFSS